MNPFLKSRRPTYCAFCKSHRRTYRQKHVGLTNVVAAGLIGAGVSHLFWDALDPRGILVFSLLVIAAEMFIYLRWRSALRCGLCGFDPLVYKRSPAEAALRVRAFFETAGDDPRFMLSKSPLVQVHRRHRETLRKNREIEATRARARRLTASRAPSAVVNLVSNENPGHNSDVQRA